MSGSYVTLSDLGFEIQWLEHSALFEVKYGEEYWGHIDMRPSALEALSREKELIDIWYGRSKVIYG